MEIRKFWKSKKRGDVCGRSGRISPQEAVLKRWAMRNWICIAKVRSGFAEVIYCAGKADEHLLHILNVYTRQMDQVFGTRATQHQYEILREKYPQVEYDPISHIIKLKKRIKGISEISQSALRERQILP